MKEKDAVVAEAKNAASGEVVFNVNYTEAGEHTYTITEKAGSEGGVTYDTATHEVTVNVTDNGQGQLVATVTGNNPTFTNTYKASSATVNITAKKVLNGKALEADKYQFELKEGDEVVSTAKNAADGTVTFKAIEYKEAGEHTYTITEKAGSEAGVTYDKSTYNVTVNVTDNGQGKLVADVKDNNPTFTNTYKATSTTATITATKVLDGKELVADAYTFELKEKGAVVATAKNTASGEVVFNVDYTEAGEHTYTITEKAGTESGVTYSTESYTVKVTVVDNGQGQLVATVDEAERPFTNIYKAASTTVNITAKKVLTGKALEAGKYEFELKEGDKVIGTATNAVDGTVAFAGIEYKEAGSHTYTISEKAGSEAGVTYDTATHKVTVEVVDNGAGKLVATVTDNNPTFTNTYVASSTQVTFTAKKVLNGKGKELAAGQFKFELKQGDTVVETATNAADGTVTFKAIDFATAGEHTYTITEVKGDDTNIKYDENSYKVTVTVTDNGAGQLVTEVTGNNPTITNTYTEPKKEEPKEEPKGEQPKGDLPNTGGADFTAFSTILGLVLAALAGLVYRAKKVD